MRTREPSRGGLRHCGAASQAVRAPSRPISRTAAARAGKVPQALDALDAALEAGFDDPGLLGRDEDLDSLHGDPRFMRALARAAKDDCAGD